MGFASNRTDEHEGERKGAKGYAANGHGARE